MRKIYCDRCKRLIENVNDLNPIIKGRFENIIYEVHIIGLEEDYCRECCEFAVVNSAEAIKNYKRLCPK